MVKRRLKNIMDRNTWDDLNKYVCWNRSEGEHQFFGNPIKLFIRTFDEYELFFDVNDNKRILSFKDSCRPLYLTIDSHNIMELIYSCMKHKNFEIVDYLIERGFDIYTVYRNYKKTIDRGFTIFHMLCSHGNELDGYKYLASKSFNFNLKSMDDKTGLDLYKENGIVERDQYVLEYLTLLSYIC